MRCQSWRPPPPNGHLTLVIAQNQLRLASHLANKHYANTYAGQSLYLGMA